MIHHDLTEGGILKIIKHKDQIVIFIFSLILISAIFPLLIISLPFFPIQIVQNQSIVLLDYLHGNLATALLGTLLIMLISWYLCNMTTKRQPKFFTRKTELGQYMISLSALENIVKKAVEDTEGLKEMQSKVIVNENNIDVFLKITVYSDYPIPELSEKVQSGVNSYMEKMSGISVGEVKILLEDVFLDKRGGHF